MAERITFSQLPKGVLESMMGIESYIGKQNISLKRLELLRVYISQLNNCAYCIDMHYKEAIAAGETNERLIGLTAWENLPFYTDEERAILAWTKAVTRNTNEQEFAQCYQELMPYYSNDEISNLTLAIIQIGSWNQLCKSCGWQAGHYQVGQH